MPNTKAVGNTSEAAVLAEFVRLGFPDRGEVDLFAVYSPDTRKVYVLPVDECPITEVWLRLIPARNKQQRKVRMAEEHTLAAWAASLGYAESASASSPPAVLATTGRW